MKVMKRSHGLTRLLAVAVALVMSVLVATPAFAAQYKIRLFAGNVGEVSLKGAGDWTDGFVEIPANYGEEIKLGEKFEARPKDPKKYYVMEGFRTSGKDNRDNGELRASIVVDRDMDFVVAYGFHDNMVQYTVRFVEQGTGKALTNDAGHTEETYEGRVGDKPVVAYSYVPGYRPMYKNITGTLKDGENVWNLPYTALEQSKKTTQASSSGSSSSSSGGSTSTTTISGGGGSTSSGSSSSSSTSSDASSDSSESADSSDDSDDASTTDNADDSTSSDSNTSDTTADDNASTSDDSSDASDDASEESEPAAAPATEEILDVDDQPESGAEDAADDATPNHGSNTTGSTDPNETQGSGDSGGPSFAVIIGGIIGALLLGLLGFLWYRTKHETGDGDDFDIDFGDDN